MPPAPLVTLGSLKPGGIAPSIFVLVERGAARRPGAAGAARGELVLVFSEGYPPVSVVFGGSEIVVGEEPSQEPDAEIHGSLPALSALLLAPTFGGVPRSRSALTALARREIRVVGRRALARRFLAVVSLEVVGSGSQRPRDGDPDVGVDAEA